MYFILCVLARYLSFIPRPQALYLGTVFAGLLHGIYHLSPHKNLLQSHIKGAFPELALSQQNKITKQHVERFVWAFFDFLRFWRFKHRKTLPRHVVLQGESHYQKAFEQGNGVILISAHFGCWELIPAVSALQGHRTTVMVQKPVEPYFDKLFTQFRGFAGVKTVNNDSYKGIWHLLKALRKAEVVGIVIDQHGESEQLIGNFFDHAVSLPTGPAALAKKTGAAVVPVFSRWWGNQQIVEYLPAIHYQPEDTHLSFTQSLYQQIETQIRKYPENWLWSYNRWDKYKP